MARYARLCGIVCIVAATTQLAAVARTPVPPRKPPADRSLDRVELTPGTVSFEIDYEGSPHTGCYQTMRAIAVYLVFDEDGFIWEDRVNVSGDCSWTFGNTAIYSASTGQFGNLSADGLVVTWEWGPDHAGSTSVTVSYLGKSASGTITATDSRP